MWPIPNTCVVVDIVNKTSLLHVIISLIYGALYPHHKQWSIWRTTGVRNLQKVLYICIVIYTYEYLHTHICSVRPYKMNCLLWIFVFFLYFPTLPRFSLIDTSLWLHLWSSSQSSWLQIRRSGFDSRRYHIFWEVVGLELCPLNLVSKIEELLGKKVAAPV
jgi:hypothetical protein